MLNTIRDKLVYLKLCYSRSATYLSIINTGMLLYVFLKGLDLNFGYWNIPLFIIMVSMVLIFGHLDIKLGLYRTEVNKMNNNNQILNEILKEVRK